MNVINDYLYPERYPADYAAKFAEIRTSIAAQLADYPNFVGVDFCDVTAGGIQIRGHHKEVTSYTYGKQVTVKYDLSNAQEVAQQFVTMWKEQDTDTHLAGYKGFLTEGKRWGWD